MTTVRPADGANRSLSPALCQLILAAAVIVVFGRLALFDFTWWDDVHTIHHNPTLNPRVSWTGLAANWTRPTSHIYIPLTYTVWTLLAIVARVPPDDAGISLNPLWYHLANVIVHLLSALLAWRLLHALLGRERPLAALAGALLFAIHPVQVESVAWISGLKDVLAGCLMLGCLCCWVSDAPPARRRYIAALVLFAAAMLAKPSAMIVPLLLVAIDRLALGRPWRESLGRVWPFVVLAIPIAVIARMVQTAPLSDAPLWARPLIAFDSLAFYLVKIVAPVTLSIDYGRKPMAVIESGAIWYTWLVPAITIAAIAFVARRCRSSLPWCAVALFMAAPLPVLGLARFDYQEVSTVADHYLYVAMIGPSLMVAWAASRWPRSIGLAFVLIGMLGIRAMLYLPVWHDEQSLMSHAAAVNPKSVVALNNLARLASLRGDSAAVHAYLEAMDAADPSHPFALGAHARLALQAADAATAETYFRRLADRFDAVLGKGHPQTAVPRRQAAEALLNAGQSEAARRFAEEAAATGVDDPDLRRILARLRSAPTTTPAPPAGR